MSISLVLVVGAGASKEVNLPIGSELRTRIASALDIRFDAYGTRHISGDGVIEDAFRELIRDSEHRNINHFLASSWRIRDAMPQAMSIDNFIDSHRSDDRITICGKLAIARCILAAEAESYLFVDRNDRYPKINFARVGSTWFNSLFQLLTESCQADDIDARLSQVAIITFNHDRCVEHYLHGALQNYYGMTPDRATEAIANLRVFHPYGSVGSLPWQRQSGSIGYGAEVGARTLIDSAQKIKTFTEGIDPATSEIESIRSTLSQATRVVFLGFAFHRLNVSLLFPGLADGERVVNRPVFATGLGISRADCDEIGAELSKRGAVIAERFQLRNDLACAGLFKEYWRSLGFS